MTKNCLNINEVPNTSLWVMIQSNGFCASYSQRTSVTEVRLAQAANFKNHDLHFLGKFTKVCFPQAKHRFLRIADILLKRAT